MLEKYGNSLPVASDPLRSLGVSGGIVDAKATTATKVKPGQRRAAASGMQPTA